MAEDRKDYLAAFAIGAVLGIGATLLLAPPDGAKRILYEIEPALDRARKGSRRMRKEAKQVGREFRKRGGRAMDEATHQLRRSTLRRMKNALRKHR